MDRLCSNSFFLGWSDIGMAKKPTKPQPAKGKGKDITPKTNPTLLKQALAASNGILRLAPTWVPRSFLMPGKRLKLATQDLYALGAHRGGIDERWFGSTTPAANAGAPWDEGLSYIVHDGKRAFTLRDVIPLDGEQMVGPTIWER